MQSTQSMASTIRTTFLTLIMLVMAACSSMLDPTVCESDEDCQGGTCSEGICIGEIVEEGADASPMVPDAVPMSDMMQTLQPDMAVTPDEGMPQDDYRSGAKEH